MVNRIGSSGASSASTPVPTHPSGEPYNIRKGDTLSALARQWGVSVDDILKANPSIKDANKILAGARLHKPTPSSAAATPTAAPSGNATAPGASVPAGNAGTAGTDATAAKAPTAATQTPTPASAAAPSLAERVPESSAFGAFADTASRTLSLDAPPPSSGMARSQLTSQLMRRPGPTPAANATAPAARPESAPPAMTAADAQKMAPGASFRLGDAQRGVDMKKLDAHRVHARVTVDGKPSDYTLDLQKPQARKLYDQLAGLDASKAPMVARTGGTGVTAGAPVVSTPTVAPTAGGAAPAQLQPNGGTTLPPTPANAAAPAATTGTPKGLNASGGKDFALAQGIKARVEGGIQDTHQALANGGDVHTRGGNAKVAVDATLGENSTAKLGVQAADRTVITADKDGRPVIKDHTRSGGVSAQGATQVGEGTTVRGNAAADLSRQTVTRDGHTTQTDARTLKGGAGVTTTVGESGSVEGNVAVSDQRTQTKVDGKVTRDVRVVGVSGDASAEVAVGKGGQLAANATANRTQTTTVAGDRTTQQLDREVAGDATLTQKLGENTTAEVGVTGSASRKTTTVNGEVTRDERSTAAGVTGKLDAQVGRAAVSVEGARAQERTVTTEGGSTTVEQKRTRSGGASVATPLTGKEGGPTATVGGTRSRTEETMTVDGQLQASTVVASRTGNAAVEGVSVGKGTLGVKGTGSTEVTTTFNGETTSVQTDRAREVNGTLATPLGTEGAKATLTGAQSTTRSTVVMEGEQLKDTTTTRHTAGLAVDGVKAGDATVGGRTVGVNTVTTTVEGGSTTVRNETQRGVQGNAAIPLGKDAGSVTLSGGRAVTRETVAVDNAVTREVVTATDTRGAGVTGAKLGDATVGGKTASTQTVRTEVAAGNTTVKTDVKDERGANVALPTGADQNVTAGATRTRTTTATVVNGTQTARGTTEDASLTAGVKDDGTGSLAAKVQRRDTRTQDLTTGALTETGTRTVGADATAVVDEDATLKGNAAFTRTTSTRVGADGSVELKGSLSNDVGLSTTLGTADTVGFTRGGGNSFTFTLPKGAPQDQAHPLDAARAQALPTGASFQMTGTGKLGVAGSGTDAKVNVTRERNVTVGVTRGEASLVSVSVRSSDTRGSNAGLEMKGGKAKGIKVGGSEKNKGTEVETQRMTLDLAQPEHRAAYDQLMRGNTAPAAQLGRANGTFSTERTAAAKKEQAVSLDVAGWVGGSAQLRQETLDAKDARVAGDADRQSFNAAQGDKRVEWVERGGALEVHAGQKDISVPVKGVNVSFGFESSKLVEYRALTPTVDGVPTRTGDAKGPPVTADGARAMPQGSEFQLRGAARFGGDTGVGFGVEQSVPGVRVGVNVGVEVQKSHTATLNVQVKRLEGDRVSVSLDKLTEDRTGRDFSARIGAQVDTKALAAAGGSVLGAIAKNPKLGEKLGDVNKLLSAEFRAGTGVTRQDGRGMTFTLDLGTAEGKAAYEKLVAGDTKAAQELGERTLKGEATGVALDRGMTLQTVAREKHASFEIGGTKLFLSEALRKDGTVVVADASGTERADASSFNRKSKNIIGRTREITWEAVRVRTDGEPEGKGFFRMTFRDKDPLTSGGELDERRRLGRQLGAVEATAAEVRGNGGLQAMIGGRHGKTETNVDLFFTQRGIENIRQADRDTAVKAYGEMVAEETGKGVPAWANPTTAAAAQQTMKEYRDARRSGQSQRGDNSSNEESRLSYEYKKAFGRSIWDDEKQFEDGMAFGDSVERMAQSRDPVEWNKSFADLGKDVGFDFYNSMAAFNRLAGQDEVLVHRLSVHGKDVHVEMKDEGLVADVRARTAGVARQLGASE